MADNTVHSITIFAELIDHTSNEADKIESKLKGLENTKRAVEKAEERGDKNAAERRKAYTKEKERLENKQKANDRNRLAAIRGMSEAMKREEDRRTADAKAGAQERIDISQQETLEAEEASKARTRQADEDARRQTDVEKTNNRIKLENNREARAKELSEAQSHNRRMEIEERTSQEIRLSQERTASRDRSALRRVEEQEAMNPIIEERNATRDRQRLEYDKELRKWRTISAQQTRGYAATRREMEKNNTVWGKFKSAMDDAGESQNKLIVRLSRVGLAVRGLAVAGAIAFLRSFLSMLTAVIAQLVALVGSLIYAAGALGGAFVAGLAQAIPMLGLFKAAMSRLSLIQEAVQQNDLAQKQQFGDTGAAEAAADAADAIADAQERVKEAQEDLTEARKEAKLELRDLILAEQEAQLAFERSKLSHQQSRRALQERILSGEGNLLDVSSDQLGTEESKLGRKRSRYELGDARSELRDAKKGGIEGMERVVAATKALKDANDALADAHRNAARAAGSQSSAETNLQYALSQLTKTEKKLYERMISFRDRLKKTLQPMTDTIFESVIKSMDMVEKAIFNPKIVSAFDKLAGAMGKSLEGITKLFTSDKSVSFWERQTKRGAKNLKPIESIIKNVYRTFMNIADAAGPTFVKILRLINKLFTNIAKSTSDKSSMRSFFDTAYEHFEAWWYLIGDILELIGALMGVSEGSALTTMEDVSNRIKDATDWIRNNREEATKWFDDTARATGYIFDIIVTLGAALIDIFNADSVKTFSRILDEILIPGFVMSIIWVSELIEVIQFLLDNVPFLEETAKWAIAIATFTASLSLLKGVLGGLITPLKAVFSFLWKFDFLRKSRWINSFLANFLTMRNVIWNWLLWMKAEPGKALASAGRTAGRAFARAYIAVTNAMLAIGGKLGAALSTITTNMRKFLVGRGRWIGAGLAVALIAGMIYILSDEKRRDDWINVGMLIGANIGDGIIAAINWAIDKLNDTITAGPLGDLLGIDGPIPEIGVDLTERAAEIVDQQKKQERTEQITARLEKLYNRADSATNKVIIKRIENLENKLTDAAFGRGASRLEDAGINPVHNQSLRSVLPKLPEGVSGSNIRGLKDYNAGLKNLNNNLEVNTENVRNNTRANVNNKNSQQDNTDATRRNRGARKDNAETTKEATRKTRILKEALGELNTSTDTNITKQDKQKSMTKTLRRALGRLSGTFEDTGGTSRGMGKLFGDVTNKILKPFGVKPLNFKIPDAKSYFPDIGTLGFEEGGFFGDKRRRGPDDRIIKVAGGEAILTGHHQPEVNKAMAFAKAHGVVNYGGLEQMFHNDKRLHRYAPPPSDMKGFEGGGFGPNWTWRGDSPQGLNSNIMRLAGLVMNKYPFLSVSSAYLGREGTASHHGSGEAVDIAGYPYGVMEEPARWIGATHGRSLAEGIHNPSLSVDEGAVVDPSFWGSDWGNHLDHIHAAVRGGDLTTGGLPGMGGMSIPTLKRMLVKGPEGPLKDSLQGQADKLRKAANRYINKTASSIGGFGSSQFPGGVLSEEQVRFLIRKALEITDVPITPQHISDLLNVAYQESTFDPNTSNDWDINAQMGNPSQGLMQVTQSNFEQFSLPGYKNIFNPLDSIIASIRYMLSRYGEIIGFSPYESGGMIPAFGDGGVVPGPIGAPKLIMAHGGETVLPTHESGGFTGPNKPMAKALNVLGKALGFDYDEKGVKKSMKALEKAIQGYYDGIEKANANMEKWLVKSSARISEWIYKVKKGHVAKTKTQLQISQRELKNLEEQGKYLNQQEKMVEKSIKELKEQRAKVPKENKKHKQKLTHAINKLVAQGQTLSEQIVENISARLEAQRTIFDEAIAKVDVKRSILDARRGIQESLGELKMDEDDELNPNREKMISLTKEDSKLLRNQEKMYRKEMGKAKKDKDWDRYREMELAWLGTKQALIDNEQSIKDLTKVTEDNTESTDENTYSFKTTAWEQFRYAVLNGTGGLAAGLAGSVPQLATGADYIKTGGLFELHAGEAVINRDGVRNGIMGSDGMNAREQNFYFTQPMEVADPVALSNAIGFKLSTSKAI